MNLTRTNWPKGWTPSEDAVGGDPSGLLRMDNLTIDKEGILGLVDGQKKLFTAGDNIGQVFSRTINGQEYFWIGTGSSCRRYNGSFSSSIDMQVPGSGQIGTEGLTAFSDALGQILATNGAMRTKDNVKVAPLPLGLLTPNNGAFIGPSGQPNPQQPTLTFPSDYRFLLGFTIPINITLKPPFVFVTSPDPATLQSIVIPQTSFLIDSTNISGGGPAADISQDVIQLPFDVPFNPPSSIISVDIYFLLDGTPSDQTTWQNYYFFQWLNISADLQPASTSIILSALRGDFTRSGNNSLLDWTNVVGMAVVVNTDATFPTALLGPVSIIGGITGQLNGIYNYAQVNVNNNGIYLAKSPLSPPAVNTADGSNNFNVINGSVTITPIKNDPQANEYWFYRKAATAGADNNSTLSGWNFVGKSTGGIFQDTLSDVSVLQLNIDKSLQPNLFLKSLRFDDINGLQTTLFGIEGLFNERVLYLDLSFIYLSDQLNPDAVDTRYTLKPSGDGTEQNLWLKRLTNNVLILGTTKGLYEISGTLLVAPDGSIDANIISLGEAYPPLTPDVANWNGGLYYIGADGLRVTTGSNSVNLSPALRHLFTTQSLAAGGTQNGASRHGVPNVSLYIGAGYRNHIVAAHQKLIFFVILQDGTRRLIVFDTVSKTYSLRDMQNPTGVFVSYAGELLTAYGGDLYLLDFQAGYGNNNASGLSFLLRTVFDANNQPRNRKDTFTLKLVMDTGGRSVGVGLQKDGIGVTETDESSYISLGQYATNGQATVYISLSAANITLGFRYSLQINDIAGAFTFKLYEYTIEYEPRPEQVNYLRILPTNLGTISRKRWTTFAFVVDTLGNQVSFTPYLDNVAWPSSSIVNNSTKLTTFFFFTSEAIAVDIGGILSGGVFEFYSINIEECVSEKLPTPVKFLVIPANNYGTPNRKRHTSYKYQILTRGMRVLFTPQIDGRPYTPSTIITAIKRTVEHFFAIGEGDVTGIDIGGTLASLDDTPFEFYGTITPQTVEVLPDRLEYFVIPNTNYNSPNRKRHTSYKYQINTNGGRVQYTPIVDGQNYVSSIVNTRIRKTVEHYFTQAEADVIGIDIGGILQSIENPPVPFEFYGHVTPQTVEVLPDRLQYLVIPANDYGTPNRKRHTTYKYQINTNGGRVQFTPILDGTGYQPSIVATISKKTVDHFFSQGEGDVIGIDIGGILQSLDGIPFEYYGTIIPQSVEKLPDRLEYLRTPNTNFGIAAPKRLRTIPIIIDTYGLPVQFTPIVDGGTLPQITTLISNGKKTLYHYFGTDVFGTDYGGILQSTAGFPFEFYEYGQPENVELLPVPKKFDQLGPMRFDKIGKIFGFRIRVIQNGTTSSIPYACYGDFDPLIPNIYTPLISGIIPVLPGYDDVYEVQFPKNINTTIFRLFLGPTLDSFHRYDVQVKVITSGMQSEARWLPIR